MKTQIRSLFLALGFLSSSFLVATAQAGLHWPPEQDLVVYTADTHEIAATIKSPEKGAFVRTVVEVSLLVDGRLFVVHNDRATSTIVLPLHVSNALIADIETLEAAELAKNVPTVMCYMKPIPSLSGLTIKGRLVFTAEPCSSVQARPQDDANVELAARVHAKLLELGLHTADATRAPSLSEQPE